MDLFGRSINARDAIAGEDHRACMRLGLYGVSGVTRSQTEETEPRGDLGHCPVNDIATDIQRLVHPVFLARSFTKLVLRRTQESVDLDHSHADLYCLPIDFVALRSTASTTGAEWSRAAVTTRSRRAAVI